MRPSRRARHIARSAWRRRSPPMILSARLPPMLHATRCPVPEVTSEELKERIAGDLPGALAPETVSAPADSDRPPPQPRLHGRDAPPPDLLATTDTIVVAERIPEVARYLRDQLGYSYLANLTAVDHLTSGVIELVYHFCRLDGG